MIAVLLFVLQMPQLEYNLSIKKTANQWRLFVKMTIHQQESELYFPSNYGGQDQASSIKNFKTTSEITKNEKSYLKTLRSKNNSISLSYEVVETRHGTVNLGDHYRIVLRDEFMHAYGNSIFVIPNSAWNDSVSVRINWTDLPKNWRIASSFGIDNKTYQFNGTKVDFMSTIFLAGANLNLKTYDINGNPLHISMQGNWDFDEDQFKQALLKIVTEQRQFFNDYNFPHFLVSVLEMGGGNDQGGTGRTDSFALYLSDDREIDYRMLKVLSHEIFHSWNGHRIKRESPERPLYWFSEGFSDYYGRLFLLRKGLIDSETYLAEFNKVLSQYYRNESRKATNKELSSNQSLYGLPYLRGDILAHYLDYLIRKETKQEKSLDHLMRDIFRKAVDENQLFSFSLFQEALTKYLPNQVNHFIELIKTGGEYQLPADLFGSASQVEWTERKRYYLFGEELKIPSYKLIDGKKLSSYLGSK